MTRGRVPKSVAQVERIAVAMWAEAVEDGEEFEPTMFNDINARLFGAGEALRAIGQGRAAELAFFLSSTAAHRSVPDQLPKPLQAGFGQMGGALT